MKKIIFVFYITLLSFTNVSAGDISLNQKNNLLNKIGYGFSEKEYNKIHNKNYEDWVNEQLNIKQELGLQVRNKHQIDIENGLENFFAEYIKNDFEINAFKNIDKTDYFFGDNGLLDHSLKKRVDYASFSENRLREMMVWFWFNHFNIGPTTSYVSTMFLNDYEDKIRKLSFGKFKDLLTMVANHPSMLYYLNNNLNLYENYTFIKDRVELNENYAREFLELHTLGVNGGYNQKDVQELTRILSGHNLVNFTQFKDDKNFNKIKKYADFANYLKKEFNDKFILKDFYLFINKYHDNGDKLFLGNIIKGNNEKELLEVIDIVSKHPNTAKFLSRKIAVHLMSDNPSEKLIDNMAEVYLKNDTSIKEVIKFLLLSEEFKNALNKPDKYKDLYTFILSTTNTAFIENPLNEIDNKKMVIKFLRFVQADPYYKTTPEGFSVYGKDWISSARLQEKIFFLNEFLKLNEKKYKINYTLLNKLSKNNIRNREDAIKFFMSESWIKR